jgi:hypothetical protein
MKSWAGKALETVNCCAFLKRRFMDSLEHVDSSPKMYRGKKSFFFNSFAMFYLTIPILEANI